MAQVQLLPPPEIHVALAYLWLLWWCLLTMANGAGLMEICM